MYIDPLGLDIEIIFWSPMANPGSIFGHVSSRGVDGSNYSFGPGGWDGRFPTTNEYINRQIDVNDRSGIGLVVELNEEQDAQYDQCMSDAKSTQTKDNYNLLTNNCTSAAQICLQSVGIQFPSSILPSSFQQELYNSGAVGDINWYRSPK